MSEHTANESLVGKTIHIGVVFFPLYQLLDAVGPMDYLNNHSKSYLETLGGMPPHLIAKATDIRWHFIGESLEETVQPTTGPPQRPTHTFTNPPPHLDYILVPGTDPKYQFSPACTEFFKTQFPKIRALLTVCTGSIALAQTGILDGHKVCSNKWVLGELAKAGLLKGEPFKNVKWIGDRRWIVDGKIWSAAGVTAGIDLIAEFARVHLDREIVELTKEISEEKPKPDSPDDFAHILRGVDLN